MRRRLAALALILAAACGGPRAGLGTGANPCFRALPAAAAAVHHNKGSIVGVRRVKPRAVASLLPEAQGTEDLCLVAFRDHFKPGDVEGARIVGEARYAVVAVRLRSLSRAGAFVADRLPFRFPHRV